MLISPYVREKAAFNHPSIIGTSVLPVVDKLKIVGVQFFTDLTWRCHIASVRGKMNSMVGVLNRFGSTLNCDTRVKIFNAFIKPHITFTLRVCGNADAGCITSMNRTLRHAIRVICCNKMAELDKNVNDVTLILPFRLQTWQSNVIRIFNAFITNSIAYYLVCNILSTSHKTRSSRIINLCH